MISKIVCLSLSRFLLLTPANTILFSSHRSLKLVGSFLFHLNGCPLGAAVLDSTSQCGRRKGGWKVKRLPMERRGGGLRTEIMLHNTLSCSPASILFVHGLTREAAALNLISSYICIYTYI